MTLPRINVYLETVCSKEDHEVGDTGSTVNASCLYRVCLVTFSVICITLELRVRRVPYTSEIPSFYLTAVRSNTV